MTADEIKNALHARALDVCAHLLPAGRLNGDEFEVGSLAGKPGRSLKINLNGKVGLWKDFASGDGGDNLLELWHRVRNCDVRQAMREAAEWLGLSARRREDNPRAPGMRTPVPPDAPTGHPKWASNPAGVWCYTDASGAPWLIVYRYDTKTRKAFFQYDYRAKRWIEKGGHQLPNPRPLYRLGAFATRPASTIVLVEGEKCVDALASVGIDATTSLGGEGQVRKADFSPLRGWRVRIWPDADEPGRRYAETAAKMLRAVGAEPFIVPIPEGKADGWDAADALRDGWMAEEIHAQLDAAEPSETQNPQDEEGCFCIITDREFEREPVKQMQVDGLLEAGGLALLYGPPDSMKTFLAVLLAYSVATGRDFHRFKTEAGATLYIVAESTARFKLRTRAWRKYHSLESEALVHLLPEPVQFMREIDTAKLLAALRRAAINPVLIVVDTLARCAVGADENSAKDMGLFIAGLERIRRATGACILVIHHTGKDGAHYRGSSSLLGAFETVISVTADGDFVTAKCERQKEGEPFDDLLFRKVVVDLGDGRTSCVLVPAATGDRQQTPKTKHDIPGSVRKALDALRDHFDEAEGATSTEWMRVAGLADRTFYRAVKELRTWGYVRLHKQRYRLTAKGDDE